MCQSTSIGTLHCSLRKRGGSVDNLLDDFEAVEHSPMTAMTADSKKKSVSSKNLSLGGSGIGGMSGKTKKSKAEKKGSHV